MNRSLKILVGPFLLVFALSLFTSRPTFAQASQGTAQSVENRLQMISKELNLTDDQKTKLRPILQDEQQQMQAVHNDTSLTRDQKMAKMKDIRESHQPQINQILTPDQQKKWAEMKKEAKEKHEQHPE